MSDYILLAKEDNISCDGCPSPAILLDGSGEFMCEICADIYYGQEHPR